MRKCTGGCSHGEGISLRRGSVVTGGRAREATGETKSSDAEHDAEQQGRRTATTQAEQREEEERKYDWGDAGERAVQRTGGIEMSLCCWWRLYGERYRGAACACCESCGAEGEGGTGGCSGEVEGDGGKQRCAAYGRDRDGVRRGIAADDGGGSAGVWRERDGEVFNRLCEERA